MHLLVAQQLDGVAIVMLVFSFGDFADIIIVLGFIMTVYVFLAIRGIKRRYLYKARVPQLLEQLLSQVATIGQLIEENSKKEIMVEMGKIQATLESLRKKVGKPERSSIEAAVILVGEYKSIESSKDKLWKVYGEVYKVIEVVKNSQEDSSWES